MRDRLKYEGKKFNKGSVTVVADPLTVEQALEIDINGKAFTVVMQTPGDEEDLTRGLLFAEDVIKKKTVVSFSIQRNNYDQITHIDAKIAENDLGKGYLSARSLLSVSSCGICGKQSLEDLQIKSGTIENNFPPIQISRLFEMQTKMVDHQSLFAETGGCHGVAAFDLEGQLLAIKEDVGRHNALDKVVGALLKADKLDKAKIIAFSGRISYEIVSKCFRGNIPIIMAVSAPSSLAVDFAKEYGITLLGFSRVNKTTCYANSWRLME